MLNLGVFGLQYNRRQFVSCVNRSWEDKSAENQKRRLWESFFGTSDDIAIHSLVVKKWS